MAADACSRVRSFAPNEPAAQALAQLAELALQLMASLFGTIMSRVNIMGQRAD
jgi:hypothetical protein